MLNKKRILAIFLLAVMLVTMLTGCTDEQKKVFRTEDDFENAKIGVFVGAAFDSYAKERFPKAERRYFGTLTDMLLNLRQDKIDGILIDEAFSVPMFWSSNEFSRIEINMPETEYAVALPKTARGEALKLQLDAFISFASESGLLAELEAKWFSDSEPDGSFDLSALTGENGTLRVALSPNDKPFSYLKNGKPCGYDVDLLFCFAKEYGYRLEMDSMDFGALFPSLAAGRCDMVVSGVTVTEERAESVLFSDIYHRSSVTMVVKSQYAEKKQTLADLANATIGIITGTNYDNVAKESFPNAKRKYFGSNADVLIALEQGKIDAYFADKVILAGMQWEGQAVNYIDEPVATISSALILAKEDYDENLLAQLNAFIAKSKNDGTLAALEKKWLASAEPTEHPDYTNLSGENGTLKIAVSDSIKPVSYQRGSLYTGYEIDFLTRFAREYGYRLEIQGVAFDALIPSVLSGKYDIGASSITITPERMESVTFTDPHFETYGVAIIRGEDTEETSFWAELTESFEKTFIREDRWKLIVRGIGVTLLISVSAAIAGTLLGLGLYMLSRSDVKAIQSAAKGFAKVYSRIIAGTPVVVILMILFYVIFGKVRDMSGVLVAIIGFTLTFGAFVYDHMTVSVGSVDRGQTEAAFALGYTKNKTFFRIIFPQAMNIFLPSYCGQTVELVKATAVVGYIAVNDLTKMGDIIRSNTYEAFFPLIVTAVIYFLLTWVLSLLLKLVKWRFEPKRRSAETILKGVKTK